jgi:hypothetical protein
MSLRIVALRVRKELADWLHRHCSDCHILPEAEGVALRSQLDEATRAWDDPVAYDVKGIDPQEVIGVIVDNLRQFGVSRVVVFMGEYEAPLVADVGMSDLRPILGRIVVTEKVLSIVDPGLTGESLVDFTPSGNSYEVTVSGTGSFLEMPTLIQKRFPGGETYCEELS